MIRFWSAACAAALICGCAASPPAVEPGKGTGAGYAPMVDMTGVEPDVYAADVDACRATALKVRVLPGGPKESEIVEALAVGVAIVFPMGIVGAAAIGGIAAYINDDKNPAGKPAGPELQRLALVNCMARRGYRNLDPNVTVTYVPPPKTDARALLRKTGADTYVAEKYAKDRNCSVTPRAVLEDKGPGYERYSVSCGDGQPMMLRCEFGHCAQVMAASD